jgi:CheY-like chemotaxis protein
VRNLVAMHGGTVSALSDGAGCGSEFIIRLPGLPVEIAAEHPATPDSAVEAKASVVCAHPQRVLIVDDNADAAELLAEIMSAIGHEVRVAYDGAQALAILETFTPEVAVLDIGLPVMDGYELAKRLRERLAASPPRLFAVTGYGQEHDVRRSTAAGFEHHFVKPLNADGLIAAIDQPTVRPLIV